MRRVRRAGSATAIAACTLLLEAVAPCAAKPGQAGSSRHIRHEVLPIPPMAPMSAWEPSGTISPNGRWLAYWDARSKSHDRVVFYDLVESRSWVVDAGRIAPHSYGGGRVLSWRQDSRACAVGAAGGWKVAWPRTRRTCRVARSAPGYESCAAWSPRTKRLAMFEGFIGNGLFRVWDGRRLTRGIKWAKAVGYPYGEERAWQCEWSPDEKLLLLRFYGHAERDSIAAGHTMVIDLRTGRPRFNWGTEAGPARWLDTSRLIFGGDDGGSPGYPEGLFVAKPVAHQFNIWLSNVLAWTLSPNRNVVWALREGHLYRTSAHQKRWQVVTRKVVSLKMWPSLSLSPRGDMAVLCHRWGGNCVSILSTSSRLRWTANWLPPVGRAKVLGWASGKSLPLIELQRADGTAAQVVQLTK